MKVSGHVYVWGSEFASFCDYSFEFWNISESLVFFYFHFIIFDNSLPVSKTVTQLSIDTSTKIITIDMYNVGLKQIKRLKYILQK